VKSKVSALMDGELDQQDVTHIIEAIRKDNDLQNEWRSYHLIGDTLRKSSRLSMNISSRVSQKLITEPTVLSSNVTTAIQKQKYKVFTLAAAASIVAMISAGLIMNNLYKPQQIMIAEQSNQENSLTAAPIMVSSPPLIHNYSHPPVEINDYLFVHREFSPGITMRGQASNIHNVEYHERYGR
jgi:sigma-E factor negative regulatory protein RseA